MAPAAGSPTGARLDVIARAFRELFALWRSLDDDLARDARAQRLRLERSEAVEPPRAA